MKCQYIIFLLISTCLSSLTAMEEQDEENETINQINHIDAQINQKYAPNLSPHCFSELLLSEDNMVDILNMTCQTSDNEETVAILCKRLCEKNNIFAKVVDFFTQKMRDDIDNFTCETIANIESSTHTQTACMPNTLPMYLQKWIIQRMWAQITYHYIFKLTGHAGKITAFDLYIPKKYAVTSGEDNTIRLWNLDSGTCLTKLQSNKTISRICFSRDGSHIAAVSNSWNDNTSILKQWNINQNNFVQTHSHYFDTAFIYIAYLNKRRLLLIQSDIKETRTCVKQYPTITIKFNSLGTIKNEGPTHIFMPRCFHYADEWMALFDFGGYTARIEQNELVITKNCPELHIFHKAINNTQNVKSLNNLLSSQMYNQLTEYEQDMVVKQMQQKAEMLIAMSEK